MFRRGINRLFLFPFLLSLFLLPACGNERVLGFPKSEAAEMLKNGDTAFILNAELPEDFNQAETRLKELFELHSAAPFYAALVAGADYSPEPEQENIPGNETINRRSRRGMEILLFCTALESPSLAVRQEAVKKLMPIVLENTGNNESLDVLNFLDSARSKKSNAENDTLLPLHAACLYTLTRYEEAAKLLSYDSANEWEKALYFFASWKDPKNSAENRERQKPEILSFLVRSLPNDVQTWAYNEALGLDGLLSPEGSLVLSARLTPWDYGSSLGKLRPVLYDGGTTFFHYPELIADLGRAYQYTPAFREEGLEVFSAWINLLEGSEEPFALPASILEEAKAAGHNEHETLVSTLGTGDIEKIKFALYYYAARIERSLENYSASSEFFRGALALAPDELQSDACIWYILMNEMADNVSSLAPLLIDTMPQWKNPSYFEDILENLSAWLTRERQWNTILEVFLQLEKNSAPAAQYAWILGRAVEEGYLKTERRAASFFRAAYEDQNASFYYRAMAASALDINFAPEKIAGETEAAPPENQNKDSLDFILGFFECGAASFAPPYVEVMKNGLSITELRKIARTFAASFMWKESLDLVSGYMTRNDYRLSREDLRLFYPRPFKDLAEKYSGEAEIEAEILYGLMRTESYFMSGVVSRSGAIGLTQLMVPTADDMAARIARGGGTDYRDSNGIDLKNPEINIHIGSYYLNYLTAQMENTMLALLAYNGGMGRMRRWLAADSGKGSLPYDLFLETIEFNETREYGRLVLAAAAVYGYLYYGKTMKEVAADIYK